MQSSKSTQNVERPPRVRIAPESVIDDGEDACELAAAYGLVLDDWQRDILRVWLGRDSDDKYTARTCGLVVPRQNGKNACLEVRELYGMIVNGERILHTAHEVRTSMKAFQRLKSFFGDKRNDPAAPYPELNALVKRISNVNGQEGIFLTNGGSVEFSSRSRGASRGFTVDVTIYDEAQALTDEQVNASMPAKSAAPSKNPQTIYTGTPPDETQAAEVFARVRQNAPTAPRTAWHEWGVSEIGDVRDKARWYETNPAMPQRIDEETIEDEVNNMSIDGFARERLGWWSKQGSKCVIDSEAWDACATDDPATEGITVFAVKFEPSGNVGTLCFCTKPEEGKPHVEFIESEPVSDGLQWLEDFLANVAPEAAQIVVDGAGYADDLLERLRRRGLNRKLLVKPRASDVVSACAKLLVAVNEGTITHLDEENINAAATKTVRRNIGKDGWGFASTEEGDASIIEACALAYWQAMTTKRNPSRRGRIG